MFSKMLRALLTADYSTFKARMSPDSVLINGLWSNNLFDPMEYVEASVWVALKMNN